MTNTNKTSTINNVHSQKSIKFFTNDMMVQCSVQYAKFIVKDIFTNKIKTNNFKKWLYLTIKLKLFNVNVNILVLIYFYFEKE